MGFWWAELGAHGEWSGSLAGSSGGRGVPRDAFEVFSNIIMAVLLKSELLACSLSRFPPPQALGFSSWGRYTMKSLVSKAVAMKVLTVAVLRGQMFLRTPHMIRGKRESPQDGSSIISSRLRNDAGTKGKLMGMSHWVVVVISYLVRRWDCLYSYGRRLGCFLCMESL
ncbi:hypothetical protein L1987_38142 [Smallanthus sonchifolius]|uniref:Uncharacterized protein n=1 Tax=Smallanthus sonchifolius TaxID=185202 RepID=A0ACB9HI92_9ASTR|nr:hypothetical protein L1987_38142 [Smallanthus sonchifolius]